MNPLTKEQTTLDKALVFAVIAAAASLALHVALAAGDAAGRFLAGVL